MGSVLSSSLRRIMWSSFFLLSTNLVFLFLLKNGKTNTRLLCKRISFLARLVKLARRIRRIIVLVPRSLSGAERRESAYEKECVFHRGGKRGHWPVEGIFPVSPPPHDVHRGPGIGGGSSGISGAAVLARWGEGGGVGRTRSDGSASLLGARCRSFVAAEAAEPGTESMLPLMEERYELIALEEMYSLVLLGDAVSGAVPCTTGIFFENLKSICGF
ncbi:hypothetical protein EKPV-NSW-ORF022 [Eastern grey kangaroopox virus]|uniref:Uncharacterized protein n=1 Tax=Eastern grey kangaroopox virus TaxID=2042482 RepID=A0A345Z0N7_9POXV|nr:hypothetical protein EKPV-NSW-ORF022 [Eastern grey kangaroopox virus]